MHAALLLSSMNQEIYSYFISVLQPCCLLACTALLFIWFTYMVYIALLFIYACSLAAKFYQLRDL
jgi:hypothetical protein